MTFFISYGQTKTCPTIEVSSKQKLKALIKNFNLYKNENSYNFFSDSFKDKISKEEMISFLNELNIKYGRIIRFENFFSDNNQYLYKVSFEKSNRQLLISLDKNCEIQTFLFKKFIKPSTSKISLSLPFDTIWYTHWGGNTLKQNRHIKSDRQSGAFDFAIKDKNKSTHKGNGMKNEDYYAWDKNILCPCEGKVIESVDGIEDNMPGALNNLNPHGNYLLIKCNDVEDEYIAMYHFKKGSVKVIKGDSIAKGQIIAKCGNSGRSTEPHLHFHIQDSENDSVAVGVIAKFENVFLVNKNVRFDSYTPVKDDFVKQSD